MSVVIALRTLQFFNPLIYIIGDGFLSNMVGIQNFFYGQIMIQTSKFEISVPRHLARQRSL
jgi:hypothetical protein